MGERSIWGVKQREETEKETHGSQTHPICPCSLDLHHTSRSDAHTRHWRSEIPQQCSLPCGWPGRGPRPHRSAPAPHLNCQNSQGLHHSST